MNSKFWLLLIIVLIPPSVLAAKPSGSGGGGGSNITTGGQINNVIQIPNNKLTISGIDLPCLFFFNNSSIPDDDPGCSGVTTSRTITIPPDLVGNFRLAADGSSETFLVFVGAAGAGPVPSDCPCAAGWTANGVDAWVGASCSYDTTTGNSSVLVIKDNYWLTAQYVATSCDPASSPLVCGCSLQQVNGTTANDLVVEPIVTQEQYNSCVTYLVDNGVCTAP
ncbi:MAG: hypothetical protein ACU84H_08810 [Gammaproteobacteria bacterium]